MFSVTLTQSEDFLKAKAISQLFDDFSSAFFQRKTLIDFQNGFLNVFFKFQLLTQSEEPDHQLFP